MSDMGDDFRAMREHRRMVNEKNRERRGKHIEALRFAGYDVKELTPYQFRVEGRLDIYPTNACWHDIETKERGSFSGKNLKEFVVSYLQSVGIKPEVA